MNLSEIDEINILASRGNWPWPQVVRGIFRPRGVNMLVAGSSNEFVDIIERRRIHTAIVDMDSGTSGGMATVKIIRMGYPRLPCILLTGRPGKATLKTALSLGVFSVLDKPVDMELFQQQLNRLFIKKYNSNIFA
ncbi:MAG: response regulator [Planctomycetota bacterium]